MDDVQMHTGVFLGSYGALTTKPLKLLVVRGQQFARFELKSVPRSDPGDAVQLPEPAQPTNQTSGPEFIGNAIDATPVGRSELPLLEFAIACKAVSD